MEAYLIQGSESWKNKRRSCITATDISKILGINPYETCYQLWSRKLELIPEQEENDSMRLGSKLEPIALTKFIEKIGINMRPNVVFHSTDQWKMASLDGISDCGKQAVEIKCSQKIFDKAKQGIIDPIYYCQMNWQMHVLDIKNIYFASYWNDEIVIIKVDIDNDFLKENMSKIHNFFKCLLDFTPPEMTNRDYVIREDLDWYEQVQEYKNAKERREEFEKEEKKHKDILIEMANGKSTKGCGIIVSNVIRKGNIDYKSIPELKSIDLEKYRKGTTNYMSIRDG